ncbi:MAG TPA: corrinoid protein [Thermodesulfobacteriota bacterium]|nr:corrinoid protein [Thermodesulfobacteriota bacterium]
MDRFDAGGIDPRALASLNGKVLESIKGGTMDILKSIEDAIVKRDIQGVKALTQEALDQKISPSDILNKGLIKGLEIIGKLFESQEIFVPELLLAGMAMKEALVVLRPALEKSDAPPVGKMVIGTVEGDVHDIGKNIVSMIFTGSGFEVIDLGINVPAATFIETVEREKPEVLALSCLYTPTRLAMKDVIRLLEEKNLRKKVKVIIGGAPIDQSFAKMIGADGYAPDPPSGVKKVMGWLGK